MLDNFCQEYGDLISHIEPNYNEALTVLGAAKDSRNIAKMHSLSADLNRRFQKIESLRESIATLPDGREIKQIEFMGLEMLASQLNKGPHEFGLKIVDGHIINFQEDRANHDFDLRPLKLFKSLKELKLSQMGIRDPSVIGDLIGLENLSIHNTNLKDISSFSNLTNLKKLDIYLANLKDINGLAKLTNLESLKIMKSEISDINALSNLTNLKILYLSDNPLENINTLNGLKGLQVIGLSNTMVKDLLPLIKLKKENPLLKEVWLNNMSLANKFFQYNNIKMLENMGVMIQT